ncbi:hypothetical protein BD769DRAFT_1670973 [Suillus cothurnatus]|nr:hypothetical protein BD769DRAFT_1670973 [Suillus cothurnatus]
MDARSSEIKKLQNVAGNIFELPSKYFTDISYDRASVPEIQKLLGVTSATNPTYTTFPLVLFPNLIEDKSLKTVFGNWALLAQILKAALRGVTSLHQGSSHGGGAHTNSQKWDILKSHQDRWRGQPLLQYFSSRLTLSFLRVLVTKWKSKRIEEIVAKINNYVFGAARTSTIDTNHEDHTDAINRAMAALDIDTDDELVDAAPVIVAAAAPPFESISQPIAAAATPHAIPQPDVESISGTSALSNIDEDIAVPYNEVESQAAGGGRGRGRKKKTAAGTAVPRATRSRK